MIFLTSRVVDRDRFFITAQTLEGPAPVQVQPRGLFLVPIALISFRGDQVHRNRFIRLFGAYEVCDDFVRDIRNAVVVLELLKADQVLPVQPKRSFLIAFVAPTVAGDRELGNGAISRADTVDRRGSGLALLDRPLFSGRTRDPLSR